MLIVNEQVLSQSTYASKMKKKLSTKFKVIIKSPNCIANFSSKIQAVKHELKISSDLKIVRYKNLVVGWG